MVAEGELTLVDEMIASRVYTGPCPPSDGTHADRIPDGSLLKRRLLQDSGSTSNGVLTLAPLRLGEVKSHLNVYIHVSR
jgi:hypothetical protein